MTTVLSFVWRKLQPVGLGVAAAIATVLALDHYRAPRPPVRESVKAPESRSGESLGHSARPGVDLGTRNRLAQIEAQVKALQEAKAEATAEPGDPRETELNPAEARRQVEAFYEDLERAHEREGRDPNWANEATTDLTTSLNSLGERLGFSVSRADCKTTSCRAAVTFPSLAEARTKFAQLAEATYGNLNCEQHIRLEESADPSGPCGGQLYLDCTEQRASTVN